MRIVPLIHLYRFYNTSLKSFVGLLIVTVIRNYLKRKGSLFSQSIFNKTSKKMDKQNKGKLPSLG